MAYDEGLAQRVRELLEDESGSSEKQMFGGLCFLVGGHMVCGILESELMVRVGAAGYDAALAQPHAREMDFTGRAMKGLVYVAEEGLAEDEALAAWVERGMAHARSLPPKSAGGKPARKAGTARARGKKAAAKASAKRKRAGTRKGRGA